MGHQSQYGFHRPVYSKGEEIFGCVPSFLLLYFTGMAGSFVLEDGRVMCSLVILKKVSCSQEYVYRYL